MMSSKRHSMAPPAPKPPTELGPSVHIADNASLTGTHPITINAGTIIHPRTKLNSSYGAVTIGQHCILCERSVTGMQTPSESGQQSTEVFNNVVIEVGATVEALRVGEGCIIEVGAVVGKGAVLGKVRWDVAWLLEMCADTIDSALQDRAIVYGGGERSSPGPYSHLRARFTED